MIVTFTGRIKITRDRINNRKTPYLVEVWDDDENERDERLEKSFRTAKLADDYARTIHELKGVHIPLIYEDDGGTGRWSAPLKIRAEVE